uniref:protein neuralized-like n=1 Tax=Styela clava TaxID=7725 RepID=UPI00193A0F94|nr:protein neuralized-like [Styela clava]
MTLDVITRSHQPSNRLRIIGNDDDVIEREKELRLPLHKRLEFVAGFDIHQLVRDARQHRHTLHTRDGFYLSTSPSELATLFQRSPTRGALRSSTRASIKSAKRLMTSAKSSQNSTTSSSKQSANTNTSSSGSNQTLPSSPDINSDLLRFDYIHGANVTLSCDRYTATRRHNSFCDGIVLGHRPIKVGERIHFRFNKVRRDWRGGFRLGFTTQNPSTLSTNTLPSYAVPDLSRKSRFWAVPVPDKYVAKNNLFSVLLQRDGRVLYFINNENKGTFLKGVNYKKRQWPVMDLYGRVIQITIVDDETAAQGNASFSTNDSDDEDGGHGTTAEIQDARSCGFHETCGRNIRMDARRCIAKRVDSFWNSLTFLSESLRPHDVIYVEIAKANTNYAGALGVGVTNVNPASINIHELPDNADLLTKNTSQYWNMSRDVETCEGDQLGFEMNTDGRITCSKNGECAISHLNADLSRKPLWLAFDVYGSTTTIRLMGIIRAYDPSIPPHEQERRYTLNIDDVIASDDDTECMMCFKKDRQRNCAIQPCGHVTLCSWCAITCMVKQSLRFIVCPICGGPVRDVIKILSNNNRRESLLQMLIDEPE